jgi:hypothetical protein
MPLVQAEWSKATRNRAPSRDGGSMWFMIVSGLCQNFRLGRATREKWRIPDENAESGLFSCLEL